jgi:4-hydroxybenzoate polyprenyltransferase
MGTHIALTGEFAVFPALLSVLVLFWTSGFDILYALLDCEFDRRNKLYSVPAAMGIRNAMIVSIVLHAVAILVSVVTGVFYGGGFFYWTGNSIFAALLIYQHMIVSPTNLTRIDAAFGVMNGVASVCYAVFFIADILMR